VRISAVPFHKALRHLPEPQTPAPRTGYPVRGHGFGRYSSQHLAAVLASGNVRTPDIGGNASTSELEEAITAESRWQSQIARTYLFSITLRAIRERRIIRNL